ncbi:Hypothetical protein PHPALM_6064 [Phytophthora palmivora]|uniref:Uncharacterized protein n=1 Tax=Phytophthora palmivora TaxID=4796 RepID=A0A2P4YFS2_9STRA|nr:Hypothetical protein PHPALM_6064 [Phytophthora palmivora]
MATTNLETVAGIANKDGARTVHWVRVNTMSYGQSCVCHLITNTIILTSSKTARRTLCDLWCNQIPSTNCINPFNPKDFLDHLSCIQRRFI